MNEILPDFEKSDLIAAMRKLIKSMIFNAIKSNNVMIVRLSEAT